MRYKVLKEFVTRDSGEWMLPGQEYINDLEDGFLKGLLAGKFIEAAE